MVNPTRAVVRHTPLTGQPLAKCLTALVNVCQTGAQSAEVQASPAATAALGDLKNGVTKVQGSLAKKVDAEQARQQAINVLKVDVRDLAVLVRAYESVVGVLAKGNAATINKAGLLARETQAPVAGPLGMVSVVHWKPGKHSAEAIVTWPKAPSATSYALEVNYNPKDPASPWTALTSGTSRRRTVKASAPGAQMLVRIAAQGSGGTQSEWSDPVLVTTKA
jgi:hypothetical protein